MDRGAKRMEVRKAFYRAAKARQFQAAWDLLASARRSGVADKHMYGVGLSIASSAGRTGWVDALWRELRQAPELRRTRERQPSEGQSARLNAPLCTALITAFGSDRDGSRLGSCRAVLQWAVEHGIANTTTYNAFLHCASRSIGGTASARRGRRRGGAAASDDTSVRRRR
jgi:hypothetical protein